MNEGDRMNVEEYLRAVNGQFRKDVFTADMIDMFGFIDLVPEMECLSAGNVECRIVSDILIVKRVFTTENGEVPMEKRIPLGDDISLHCKPNDTSIQVLERTIAALEEMKESDLRISRTVGEPIGNYQTRIDILKSSLEEMKQDQNSSGGLHR